jgi:hypothetical protein
MLHCAIRTASRSPQCRVFPTHDSTGDETPRERRSPTVPTCDDTGDGRHSHAHQPTSCAVAARDRAARLGDLAIVYARRSEPGPSAASWGAGAAAGRGARRTITTPLASVSIVFDKAICHETHSLPRNSRGPSVQRPECETHGSLESRHYCRPRVSLP